MAQIRLGRYETEEGELPPVCMCCGVPSTVIRDKNFSWSPSWVFALLFAGLLPFLLVAFLLTKRMRVYAPLCDAHKNHWLKRTLFVGLGFLGLVLLGVAALVLSEIDGPPGGNVDVAGYLWMGILIGLLVWLIVAATLHSSAIRAVEITDRRITLTNVASQFVDALEAQRDQDDAEDEADRRSRISSPRQESKGIYGREDRVRQPRSKDRG